MLTRPLALPVWYNIDTVVVKRLSPIFGRKGDAMRYRVLIEQDEDGVFVAEVPALPGCISQGASRDEAVANIKEAVVGYLESLREHGEPIPPAISEEVIEIDQ
jgi:predicted RNase H-like HicB family nuclease